MAEPIAELPRIAVSAVVVQRAPEEPGTPRVLLIQRARPPLRGRWSLPGGRVEPGERLADAVAREVIEETGLEVRVGPLLEVAEILEPPYHYVILSYLCEPSGGALMPGDDASLAVMVQATELSGYELTEAMMRLIRRGLAGANET